ncbi:transmembrane protein 17B-like [Stegostoma tigrinum]|uniref:transmembrane protein 17B-like n=1 Tax=Stegostoma tigrinum TaxID=3053191 RepID=UPI0028700C88|nr:transmembrane protein 17B-like [Stegostoma tigrinum]
MEGSPLPEPLRRKLSHFSQSVFSSNNVPLDRRQAACPIGQESATSLPLQICLCFNLYFFPFWWLCEIIMLELKYQVLSTYYRIVLTVLLVLISLVEVIRLYLGYIGNLREKVPELAGFWLLSLLLQIPMALFDCCNPRLLVLPLEYCVNVVFIAMLLTETVLTFSNLRRMVHQLEIRFHITHFHSLEGRRDSLALPSPSPGHGLGATLNVRHSLPAYPPWGGTDSTHNHGLTAQGGIDWGTTA